MDDRSDCTFAYYQETANAAENITDNQACDLDLRKYGKEVRYYHVDNVACALAQCKQETEDKKKILDFCGVGIHHKNGKAEK